jgi:hypothetical protein
VAVMWNCVWKMYSNLVYKTLERCKLTSYTLNLMQYGPRCLNNNLYSVRSENKMVLCNTRTFAFFLSVRREREINGNIICRV